VRLEDRKASGPAALEEFEAEPALPRARLADDADYLRAPAGRSDRWTVSDTLGRSVCSMIWGHAYCSAVTRARPPDQNCCLDALREGSHPRYVTPDDQRLHGLGALVRVNGFHVAMCRMTW
jgi:hypothetical protein